MDEIKNKDEYNPDIVTLSDDDGKEYTFEVLDAIETETGRYLAMLPIYDDPQKTLDDSGEHDTFVYNSKTDSPIYIAVQPCTDFDVKTAVDGLILQSGRDDVKATEVYFGADSIKTQSVYIEKDVNGIKQIQAFYVIPVGSGSMIVEIGSYVSTDEKTDSKIEEMLGTFSLKETK